jgi:hypothetical protein
MLEWRTVIASALFGFQFPGLAQIKYLVKNSWESAYFLSSLRLAVLIMDERL